LSRGEKYRLAVQLTAAASLLAEFDLWPGRMAVSRAHFFRTRDGVRATLARFPVPLSKVFGRLGGGETAAEKTRSAVLDAIADAVGLPVNAIDAEKDEPGFFLEGAIARQLCEIPQPLERSTARSLWALRWDVLPDPEEGVATYWRVPIPDLASRMAGALWASLSRRGQRVCLCPATRDAGGSNPAPPRGQRGVLIMVGALSADDLATVTRWTQRDECSAVVIGTYPAGWDPPPPACVDEAFLTRHLAVAGPSLERARKIVENRRRRFDPLDASEREALTQSARYVFKAAVRPAPEDGPHSRDGRLERILGLSPDGLPPDFVARHLGLAPEDLDGEMRHSAVIAAPDRWRLPDPDPLENDPLHLEVADLYPPDNPRHVLHRALGSGRSSEIETWAKNRLNMLDGFAVRDLLTEIAPGVLGDGVQSLLAEACLSILDLSGARRAMAPLPSQRKAPLEGWLDTLDRRPDVGRRLPNPQTAKESPRAAAEIAIRVMSLHRGGRGGIYEEALELLDRCSRRLSGDLRKRFEIELAFVDRSDCLDDPGWRRDAADDSPVLKAQLAHRRALHLLEIKRPRSAARLLRKLVDDRWGPGFLGAVEYDLGAAALDDGRSRDAHAHQLRAYRLLQAAGFRHLIRDVLFNLAVSDLDQLRVDRAEERLNLSQEGNDADPFVAGEWVRLELARGDFEAFRVRLASFEDMGVDRDPRFAEGLNLLRGVAALFDGDLDRATKLLRAAGQEGEVWTSVVDAASGRPVHSRSEDGWGIALAAKTLSASVGQGGRFAEPTDQHGPTVQQAVAMAVAEKVSGNRVVFDPALRSRAARALRSAGLTGWAELLGRFREEAGELLAVLGKIIDNEGLEGLDPVIAEQVLRGLGLDGLEIREATDLDVSWRIGSGDPCPEVRHGRIVLTPLGGDATEDPRWILLARILDLVASPTPVATDSNVGETGFYGVSSAAMEVRQQLRELGPSHLPICLQGETGVGKDVAAKALHRLSGRSGPFVAVNVAAIPGNLLEAELFGSVKGAFTGADRSRRGLVVAADSGTLFLDEVGDLEQPLQVKILRFLESLEVRPVGSARSRKVDVRIVSATHHDLERRVREGAFRQDLYYRIAAPVVTIPPLRHRREDIALLKELFEAEALARHGIQARSWSSDAEAALRAHDWPGNVRELRQTVEIALVRAGGATVRPEHLPIDIPEEFPSCSWGEAQREFRRSFLRAALRRNGENRSATARELGISRQALLYHLRNLGLSKTERR
jgi:DNA-binding NtrC family response regulator/tetratricopeptide (TPR) repeat protein